MAYPFDETFATGIPAGFGATGGAGGVTATWNSGQQAVDLVFTNGQNVWKITAAAQASDFWFEMDVEIIATSSPPPHFGFWLWDGVGSYEGYRLAVWNATWDYSVWTAAGNESEAELAMSAGWASVGARKTLRVDAKKSAEGIWAILLMVDGVATAIYYRRYYATVLPGIFGYGVSLRLHRAAGGTPSALSEPPASTHHGLRPLIGRRLLVPEHAAALKFNARAFHRLAATRNHYYQGRYRITGTVKEKGLPSDRPLARRVQLIDETTHFVVRETWSDALTGAYVFESINPEITYLVIAFDYRHNYRAVIADHLAADPMP